MSNNIIMEKTTPTVQETYLEKAQTKGRDYYQKVKIGGKNYYVMVLQGGGPSRIQAHDTTKLKNLAESFFSAHQEASKPNLNESDITHIDSKGIHFRERDIQTNHETGINEELKDHLMEEFDSEKSAIFQHYNKERPVPVLRENIPSQYHPYLEGEDGSYDDASIKHAVKYYTLARFNHVKDLVSSANPRAQEAMEIQLEETFNSANDFENVMDQSCNILKQHMTAQTVWEAMTNVLLPRQLIFVAAPEEEDIFYDPEVIWREDETPPLGGDNASFAHLPQQRPAKLPKKHLDKSEAPEDALFAPFEFGDSIVSRENSEGRFSRWRSYLPALPARTSIPFIGKFFSGSSSVSQVNEEFESQIESPSVIRYPDPNTDHSRDEEGYVLDDELDNDENYPGPELYSAQAPIYEENIPVTAQEVCVEIDIAIIGASEEDIPVEREQAAARTALDKIQVKTRGGRLQTFTKDERWVLKEAITRNKSSMGSNDPNSKLTTIIRELEAMY